LAIIGRATVAATGRDILQLARGHLGERYVFGSIAPKNNPRWKGPWDCAELASWLVYQVSGELYGCLDNTSDPALADAWTGSWLRDAHSIGKAVSIGEAARTAGAAVLRHSGAGGHIVISDGRGGTIEAHSTRRGVIKQSLSNRRWDTGVLVPGIVYSHRPGGPEVAEPTVVVFRLTEPWMEGAAVLEIQRALRAAGFDPGPLDGVFGPMTAAAVRSYQAARGLVPDGEVGPSTAKSLGVSLPRLS
jgi:putative peptidoglycan binding protein